MVRTAEDWNYTVKFFSGKLFVGGRGKQVAEGFWQRRVFWSLCKQNTSARQHANTADTSYVAWFLGLLSYYFLDCCSTIYSKYNKTGPNRRTRLPRVAGWELYDSFIHLSASETEQSGKTLTTHEKKCEPVQIPWKSPKEHESWQPNDSESLYSSRSPFAIY